MGNVLRRTKPLEGNRVQQGLLPGRATGLPLTFGVGVGSHKTRRDAIDGDIPGTEFMPELAGQADQCRFGSSIGLDAGEADRQSGTAGDIHDAPAACCLHARRHGLAKVKRATHVDGENCVPLFGGNSFQRLADLPQHAARIVHQNIHPATRCVYFRHQGVHRIGAGDVHRAADAAPARVQA